MGTFRFLLALSVAIDHAFGLFGHRMISGHYAVQSFYIVSGFLIAHILLTKYPDTARGHWLFYSNRLLRIFVPYWTVLAITVIIGLAGFVATGNALNLSNWVANFSSMDISTRLFLALTNLFILGQDVTLWLVRDGTGLSFAFDALASPASAVHYNILTQAWTIALELTFYLIAPFLVRQRSWLLLLMVVAAQIARFRFYKAGFYNSALDYRFFPFELALFVSGILSYRIYRIAKEIIGQKAPTIAVAVVAGSVVFYEYAPLANTHRYFYYFAVVLSLPLLFAFTKRRPFERLVGELSYPIYLVHWPVQWLVRAAFDPSVPFGGWLSALSVVVSVALSIALVVCVSGPLDRWRERRLVVPGAESRRTMTPATQDEISPSAPIADNLTRVQS